MKERELLIRSVVNLMIAVFVSYFECLQPQENANGGGKCGKRERNVLWGIRSAKL